MSQARRRQLSRLEKLAAPVIDHVRRKDNALETWIKHAATLHAVSLGTLILYGDPRADEPLLNAWRRCSKKFPDLQRLEILKSLGAQSYAENVAEIVRQDVMCELPGSIEKEKFQNLFSSAPPWLVWFTFADFTACELGLTLPDLSSVNDFARSKAVLDNWPALPDGKFEVRIRNLGDQNISVSDAMFLIDMYKVPEEQMTRLERKRFLSVIWQLPPNRSESVSGRSE